MGLGAEVALLTLASASVCLGFLGGPEWAASVVGLVLLAVVVLGLRAALERRSERRPVATVAESPALDDQPLSRRTLTTILAVGLMLRFVVALAVNLSPVALSVAPDGHFYSYVGEVICASWTTSHVDLSLINGYSRVSFYQHLNALLNCMFGFDPRIILSLINAVVATVAAVNMGKLALRLYGPRAQRITILLMTFFPSLVLWTSVNIREAWSFLAVSLVALSAQSLRSRFATKDIITLLAALAFVVTIRTYLAALIVIGVGISFVFVRVRQLPYAMAVLAILTLLVFFRGQDVGFDSQLLSEQSLERVQRLREGLSGGGSGYQGLGDTSTLSGTLLYLPLGVMRFLFAPFPWRLESWRQVIALPETVFWYWVFWRALRELIAGVRENLSKVALVLWMPLVIVIAYGLVEGNEGTAYRHRAQVMILYFVLAAGSMVRDRAKAKSPVPASAPVPARG